MLIRLLYFACLFTFTKAQTEYYDFEYKLPLTLTPLIYDLKLKLSSFSEDVIGQVEIQIQCENETDFIELHANPLFIVIENTTLENRYFEKSQLLDLPKSDVNKQTIRFDLDSNLEEKHVYYLIIHYTTKYSYDDRGLIRSKDPLRGTWFNTLFEPSHARRLFPAFDEPHYRSSFKLELQLEGEYAEKEMVALSSMETERVERKENLTTWYFHATPPIPTYIFTIAAGKFRSVCNSTTLLGKQICIWKFSYWKNWEPMANALISAIAKFQAEMIDYLLSDPSAGLNFLIVPSKLKGMENFGLLNIKENLWPTSYDRRSLQIFAKTLYHEMVHQWFGNLVTVKWWDDIWLAESLTNFLASFKPIEIDLQYDSYTEPLVSSKWANGIPSIAYTKGAIIMEMLNSIIGPRQMRRLLRMYLHVHQFGYASTESFLDLLGKITADQYPKLSQDHMNDTMEVNAVNFIKSWLYQAGHPIVSVNFDKDVNQFVISQTPKLIGNFTTKTEWPVPIWTACAINSRPEQLHWLRPGTNLALNLLDLTETNSTNAVIFNQNQAVYYKLTYKY